MRRRGVARLAALSIAVCGASVGASPGLAQQDPLTRAFDLERRGDYVAAVDAYRAVLARRPSEVSAILGLERSLVPLNRLPEIIPAVRAALAAAPVPAAPSLAPVYAAGIRAWAAAGEPDSLRRLAERWVQVSPRDELPYREWGAALLPHDRPGAKQVYLLGRERLARPEALAAELAQLALLEEDYPTALREWVAAIRKLPGYQPSAVGALQGAPSRIRPELLRLLERDGSREARRLAAELSVRWGDAVGGFRLLRSTLGTGPSEDREALHRFIESLRGVGTREAMRAQAMALEALAERSPEAQASRQRVEAAHLYSESGDRDAARRMLAGVADDRAGGSGAASAAAALVSLLLEEGKPEEAERRLAAAAGTIPADERDALARRIARGWIRQGRLDRAAQAVARDSSVDGLALQGRIRLYRGDLAGARRQWQAAGPFAGSREEATERAMLLATLQTIEADSLPELGEALLAAERGDTAAAVAGLERVAGELDPVAGGAELRLMAGRMEAARRRNVDAERLLRSAAIERAPATAAAAELELGRLLISLDRREEAVEVLEHLVLEHPQSALVPQARRLLDVARGAVPRT
ncbi:MAG TPA: hypothetical protein VNK43_11180 [Gemmatimonadales bacterium]|nr:hypothetical protein [Gemmatimonadales bacterium]